MNPIINVRGAKTDSLTCKKNRRSNRQFTGCGSAETKKAAG